MSLIDKEELRIAIYKNFDGIQCYDGSGQDICMEIDEILKTIEEVSLTGEKSMSYQKGFSEGHSLGKSESKRPTAKWIDHWSSELQAKGLRQCSKCKAGFQRFEHGTRKSDLPWIDGQPYTLHYIDKYCPNCGAKMENANKNE